MTRTRVLIAITIFAAGALLVLFLRSGTSKSAPTVSINNTIVEVELAETQALQSLGLSGRESLASGKGMLFLFEKPEGHGFWMKDMHFSIDIIWINENWQIVGIDRNVSPDTYPQAFFPPEPSQYVLEVPAGFSTANGFTAGQSVTFKR